MENPQAKPKYGMLRCSAFMAALAWRIKEKKVILITVAQAVLAVLTSLCGLLVVPAILAVIENQGTILQLVAAVLAFTLPMALFAATDVLLTENRLYPRITVRSFLIGMITEKAARTSYPNLYDKRFNTLREKANVATNGNNQATEAIWETFTTLLKNLLGFGVYLAMLTTADPWLMALVLATSVAGYFISKRLDSYGYRHREEEAKILKKLDYQWNLQQKLEIGKDMRIFGMKPWIQEVTQKALSAMRAFHTRAESVYIWGRVMDLLLAFLRNGIAYWLLIAQVLGGGMTVSAFLLYFTAVGGFTQWVTGILKDMNTLYRQCLDISTVRELLDYPEAFALEDGEPLAVDPAAPHEIRLEDVSYRYDGAEEDALSHINLTIHPREKLAVVGLNGAGKTTLVKLICGFLDPSSGVVKLDGQDIRRYNRRDYYRAFATVFQDFSVVAATVAENVAQSWGSQPDREKAAACLEKAGLTEKVASLPQGMDTLLVREVYGEGVDLSGGETQRLMLARALYKDAAFVVLDEPTAALDPIAEADMYQKYNEMTQGRLSVYISHRLASTRFCDRILFLQDHGIAEEGTHQELLEAGGGYAQLYHVQSKYYQEGYKHEEEI
ncbi:ABC transporter ATP-binding protein [Acutalibacter sp. 1XD8-33]|uniref:ABC transporter ATP-binding protein n=1 Tax=Acutalibacter sp. 1XD8-33 TaxID=2320081 RepID=UPI000EA2F185|nr:ABC transporter ATP-binding protein [Acutalibacter sp. 1XD8-33]RKJ38770.1 ABC transporter ATP-binding protein [Acutalibacter sp. 1XD8-33]